MKFNFRHHTYYFLEFVLIIFGLFLVDVFENIFQQLIILASVLASYVLLGSIHHRMHHNLKFKIMVEYVLVSLLIFAVFLFVNSSRF